MCVHECVNVCVCTCFQFSCACTWVSFLSHIVTLTYSHYQTVWKALAILGKFRQSTKIAIFLNLQFYLFSLLSKWSRNRTGKINTKSWLSKYVACATECLCYGKYKQSVLTSPLPNVFLGVRSQWLLLYAL